MKKRTPILCFLSTTALLLVMGCTRTPEDAIAELGNRGYEVSDGAFLDASTQNDPDIIELFLEAGFNPEMANGWAVRAAVDSGRTNVVGLLHTYGANLDSMYWDGFNPLRRAFQNRDTTLVLALLDRGVDPDPRDSRGRTPLLTALEQGNTQMAQRLIDAGANPLKHDAIGRTPLDIAFDRRDDMDLSICLRSEVDVLGKMAADPAYLLRASFKGQVERVEMLLNQGANPNASSRGGFSALMAAASTGNIEIVKKLLDAGADVHKVNVDGFYKDTALMLALRNGHHEISRMLVSRNADSTVVDRFGVPANQPARINSSRTLVDSTVVVPSDGDD